MLIKSKLSGLEMDDIIAMTDEAKQRIAIRSFAYTKSNGQWRQIFPELAEDSKDSIEAADLAHLQYKSQSQFAIAHSQQPPGNSLQAQASPPKPNLTAASSNPVFGFGPIGNPSQPQSQQSAHQLVDQSEHQLTANRFGKISPQELNTAGFLPKTPSASQIVPDEFKNQISIHSSLASSAGSNSSNQSATSSVTFGFSGLGAFGGFGNITTNNNNNNITINSNNIQQQTASGGLVPPQSSAANSLSVSLNSSNGEFAPHSPQRPSFFNSSGAPSSPKISNQSLSPPSKVEPELSSTPPQTASSSISTPTSPSSSAIASASSPSSTQSPTISLPSASAKLRLSPPPDASPNDQKQFESLSTPSGKEQLIISIYTHLKSNIPDWKTSESVRHSRNANVRRLTNASNPQLSILQVYWEVFGEEMGADLKGKYGIFVSFKVDFSSWHKIVAMDPNDQTGHGHQPSSSPPSSSTSQHSTHVNSGESGESVGEAAREAARVMIVQLLDQVMAAAWKCHRVRIVFTDIDLTATEGSMRAVFGGTSPVGNPMNRETEVLALNLSHTRTSPRSLLSLHKLTLLRDLYLDHCPSIQKSGKNVFSLLLKKDPIQSLQTLSVVGTSQVMSQNWLIEVEQRCPKLQALFFTRPRAVKALGWTDNIMMQTVRDPMLMPCGHIGDKASLLHMGYCSLDRSAFRVNQLISVNPAITMLQKMDSRWSATIVDANRQPLEAKVLYHTHCGVFYNPPSLQHFYPHDPDEQDASQPGPPTLLNDITDDRYLNWLGPQRCVSCRMPLGSLRTCFPNSVESTDKNNFDNLKDLSNYNSLGERPI